MKASQIRSIMQDDSSHSVMAPQIARNIDSVFGSSEVSIKRSITWTQMSIITNQKYLLVHLKVPTNFI